jgi:heme A synthase
MLPLCGASVATIFLAMLGRASAGSTTPIVIIGNVAVGVILYVLFRQLQLQFQPRVPMYFARSRLCAVATVTRSVAGVQVWLGAWTAGMAAQVGCGGNPASAPWWPQLPSLAAFDPLQARAAADAAAALSSMQLLHEISALALLLLAVPLALRLQGCGGDTRRDANRLLLALAVQAGLGIAIALADTAPWLGALHTALAAIVLGIVIRMRAGLRRA